MIGALQPLVLAKPAAIDTAQAARYFGARGEPDDRTMTLLETCAMPLLAAATPRAVWLEADTAALAEAGILRGGDVMKHLENCPQAVLLAVTLGPGVDAQIRRAGVGDIAAGVASDALGSTNTGQYLLMAFCMIYLQIQKRRRRANRSPASRICQLLKTLCGISRLPACTPWPSHRRRQ